MAEVQGSFTFPPQQMPHASTYIQNSHLEFTGENPLLSGVRRSCGWNFSDTDGGIGVENVWRNLIAIWMMNKRDFVALILSIFEIMRCSVAKINKLVAMLTKDTANLKKSNFEE